MSDFFNAGLCDGVINAFALVRSHLEKLDGFDSASFDKDLQGVVSRALGAQGIDSGYADGFEAPFSGLKTTDIRKLWMLDQS